MTWFQVTITHIIAMKEIRRRGGSFTNSEEARIIINAVAILRSEHGIDAADIGVISLCKPVFALFRTNK